MAAEAEARPQRPRWQGCRSAPRLLARALPGAALARRGETPAQAGVSAVAIRSSASPGAVAGHGSGKRLVHALAPPGAVTGHGRENAAVHALASPGAVTGHGRENAWFTPSHLPARSRGTVGKTPQFTPSHLPARRGRGIMDAFTRGRYSQRPHGGCARPFQRFLRMARHGPAAQAEAAFALEGPSSVCSAARFCRTIAARIAFKARRSPFPIGLLCGAAKRCTPAAPPPYHAGKECDFSWPTQR